MVYDMGGDEEFRDKGFKRVGDTRIMVQIVMFLGVYGSMVKWLGFKELEVRQFKDYKDKGISVEGLSD